VIDLTNDRGPQAVALDAVVGRNWLLTIDRTGGNSADAFRGVFKGETELGHLDSLSFLAALLEAHVGSYFAAVADVEVQLDSFDEKVMRGQLAGDQAALSQLVAFRRTLAVVRRHLLEHRDGYATLGDPDFTSLGSEESAKRFQALLGRLERAVDGAEVARQMVGGSFEILMTKTGQRTNDIMKVLTLVSAALLPSSVIAGVLGMNFKLPFFEHGYFFWVAIGFMAALMLGTVLFAWRRSWL
jgi:Mg2+ and Co2+ transporter CorA